MTTLTRGADPEPHVALPAGADPENVDAWDADPATRLVWSTAMPLPEHLASYDIRIVASQRLDGTIVRDEAAEGGPLVYLGGEGYTVEDSRQIARALLAAADLADTWVGEAVNTGTEEVLNADEVFEGDRYERMRRAAEILAADEGLVSAELPYNSEGLLAFVDSIAQLRLLHGLSEYDSNTIALLVTLDFLQGPRRMAWRIYDMLTDEPKTPFREHDNEIAVSYAMVGILRMVVGAWLKPDPVRNLTALYADLEEASGVIKHVANESGDTGPFREAASNLLLAGDAVADAIEALDVLNSAGVD